MKIRFLALLLFCALLPALADAQNVLVPSGSATTAKPTAAAATTTTPAPASDPVVTSTLTAATYGGQSLPAIPNVTYIPVAQQNAMIQMEQRNLALAQQGITQTQQADQVNAAQAAASNQTTQSLSTLSAAQQTNLSTKASLNARVAVIQHRLAILQSGPITLGQFAALYQSN